MRKKTNLLNITTVLVLSTVLCSCDSVEDKKGRFLLKGNEKMAENDPKGAIQFYTEALELDSTYSETYYNKALAHLQLNQLSASIADLNLAIQYRADYYDAIFQRGLNYLDNGEFYKAREDAQALLNLDSINWKSTFLNGLAEERLKNFTAALQSFEKSSELNPENSDLLVNRATIRYYQKNFDESNTLLDKAEDLNPNEPNLYNLRSMIYFDQQNYQSALEQVDKAITLDNRQAYFYNNKGLYLLFLDQQEEGLKLINQSIRMDPANPYAMRNKGIYYVMQGDKASAIQYLEELAAAYPQMELVSEYLIKAQAL